MLLVKSSGPYLDYNNNNNNNNHNNNNNNNNNYKKKCSTTGITKTVVCVILSMGWCI